MLMTAKPYAFAAASDAPSFSAYSASRTPSSWLGAQAAKAPWLRGKQPWKAVWEKDAWLGGVITRHYRGDDRDLQVMAAGLLHAYEGESIDTYAEQAHAILRGSENTALKRPYLKTACAPMRELLRHLAGTGSTPRARSVSHSSARSGDGPPSAFATTGKPSS
jgi:hypothetical protein